MAGYSCYAAETCTYSANCADDRRNSLGDALGPVPDKPVIVQRGAQFVLAGRRHLRRVAEQIPMVPLFRKTEILQLQYIDKVFDVGFADRAVLGAFVEETAELPQLRRLHGLLLPCPSLCTVVQVHLGVQFGQGR